VKVDFTSGASPIIRKLTDGAGKPIDRLSLEAPLLTALAPGEKRRFVPLASIPEYVRQAVLAIEDQRFYEHPGVDPIRAVGAAISNLRGNKKYLEGASTITQQIIKNTFLTPDQTYRRKIQEQFMALVLDSRFTKDQIFELYLNEITLGQRGPFAIHGVGEASRIFFGKDVSNVTLAEAATLAGMIRQPSALNPFRNPERARVRRNVVLAEMAKAKVITEEAAEKAAAEPVKVQTRALENEAPYFADYVSKVVDEDFGGLVSKGGATDVYTSLDLHLQRMAQEAVAKGLVVLDKQLPKKKQGRAQVALISVDPRTGEILALVGGRGYNETQYNRAMTARRQPGSIFKPFVYIAAFEKMLEQGYQRPHTLPRSWWMSRRCSRTATRLRAGQLQGRVRRPDDTPPRAGALEERRHDQSGGTDRVRPRGPALAKSRRGYARAAVPVDCAGRVRSFSAGNSRGVHHFHEQRCRSEACVRSPASSTTGRRQTCR
jgi:penicillin-binding protein 1B